MKLETVPCTWCKTPTHMTRTKLCDRCWELESRIASNPDLAERMLAKLKEPRQ